MCHVCSYGFFRKESFFFYVIGLDFVIFERQANVYYFQSNIDYLYDWK